MTDGVGGELSGREKEKKKDRLSMVTKLDAFVAGNRSPTTSRPQALR